MVPSKPGPAGGKCPICRMPSQAEYRPFCSRRCADVDLSRWLRGTYAIPGEPPSDAQAEGKDDADPSAPPSGRDDASSH
jgi:uncharacterized protein